ncbi:MAG: family 78 glycoside hydrolase catalytic domain, partial [Verrucomicrobiales bacterium]|nr:family 78 glycoside hydrolase catalytic domain [Verrucomicrobiales bacterium]
MDDPRGDWAVCTLDRPWAALDATPIPEFDHAPAPSSPRFTPRIAFHGSGSTGRDPVLAWSRCVLLAVLASAFPSAFGVLRPEATRLEYLENPVGVESAAPRFSWKLVAPEGRRGARQTAYRILVSGDADRLARGEGDVWDSGRVESPETAQIPYAGPPPGSGSRLHWKVAVWDERGESAWSEPARWTMGIVRPEDWRAEWIAFRDREPLHADRSRLHLPPARHYRKAFVARGTPKRVTAHVSALGICELYANGKRVGDSWFEPGWADYAKRGYYRTHDLTHLLRSGTNTVGAVVAEGWYAGYVGYGLLVGYGPNRTGRNFYGKTPALRVQVEIEYADGSTETVGTDRTWEVSADGPIREADLIMGEIFDARRDRPDWCLAGGASSWRWDSAVLASENGSTKAVFHDTRGAREIELGFRPPPRLQAYSAPPIRVTGERPAVAVNEVGPGVFVFDLGQNIAGVVRLKTKGPAGTRVQLRHGEMVHPDGRLMTENLRRARATDAYVLRGDAEGETWQPRFTYHGFRYVELTGLAERPGLDAVTGLVLHNDTPLVGEFACSDEVMTRFWKNTQWTQRANFVEMPTDCPQRDERLGWMGDAQAYVRAATYNADVAAFFGKWLDDVVEAQREFGAYPDYAPYPMAHGEPGMTWGTAWTDAGIICPWTIWKVYGDARLPERLWPSMTRFMEWRRNRAPDLRGRGDGNTWGDWLNVNEPTPLEYVDAAYFKYDADLMADMASALGRPDEAAAYRQLARRIAERFAADYLAADGTLKVGSQTAHVLALAFGLLPEDRRAPVASKLAEREAANGYRMTTGFLGTRDILPVLSRHGHHDLALRLFGSRKFPSWGYEVVNGATTVWERWDSFTHEHGFNGAEGNQNASMNSFSHYAFGAITAWMFRDLAGIDTEGEGYKRIRMRPGLPSLDAAGDGMPIHWVRAEYDGIRGRIRSAWERRDGRLSYEVSVP